MKLIDPIIEFHAELQSIRRDIHAHPELCYEEKRTSELVAHKLTEWGIPVVRGMGLTGVVGIISNGSSERAIGLRADMDALPMQEVNTFPHASQHAGKMHACGHDGHTAMLLGAAHYLATHRNFDGTVYVIFQPAEEGGGGAKRMMDDGLFEQFPMEAVFGMHNWPGSPVGSFGVTDGPMMASSNEFEVTVRGLGSHAAQPNKGVDPIMIAVQIAQSWQTIISRNKNPLESGVLSITQIHAGSAYNVIPGEAKLCGTVRAFSDEVRALIRERMRALCAGIASAFEVEISADIRDIFSVLVNQEEQSSVVAEVARTVVDPAKVFTRSRSKMGSEDFADMLHAVPGAYFWVGQEGSVPVHNPGYILDDKILPIGASMFARIIETRLPVAAHG